jgi:hypothetical protein
MILCSQTNKRDLARLIRVTWGAPSRQTPRAGFRNNYGSLASHGVPNSARRLVMMASTSIALLATCKWDSCSRCVDKAETASGAFSRSETLHNSPTQASRPEGKGCAKPKGLDAPSCLTSLRVHSSIPSYIIITLPASLSGLFTPVAPRRCLRLPPLLRLHCGRICDHTGQGSQQSTA